MEGFKPNLIPNNPKDGSFTTDVRNAIIDKNGGIEKYCVTFKKDGCRMQLGIADTPLSRALKPIKSKLVNSRFQKLNELCQTLNITLDGEFYMHGLKFNEIFKFFSNSDITRDSVKNSYTKEFVKSPHKFIEIYNHRTISFLTTFHEDLKFWIFDGIVLDRPDLTGYRARMEEISKRLSDYDLKDYYCKPSMIEEVVSCTQLDTYYTLAISHGWEGLVLTHEDHEYKYGRNSVKQGTLLKLKDDTVEYDGIVLDVVESTVVKEGVEKTVNELGRSVTSQKQDDRVPSGLAKGFLVEFEGLGTFPVGLRGFDNEAKAKLLKDKVKYIGRHFKYSGMKPVKDFPRHAYFDCWRDEK